MNKQYSPCNSRQKSIKKTSQINSRIPVDVLERFQKLYPYSLSRFVRNSIIMAIDDRNYFMRVFFNPKGDN